MQITIIDCPPYVDDINNHLERPVTDYSMWGTLRESQTLPNFSDVYIELVFKGLEEEMNEQFPNKDLEFNVYINNLDTHLCINDSDNLTSYSDVIEFVKNEKERDERSKR